MGQVLHYVLLGNAALFAAFVSAWLLERTAIMLNLRTAYRLRLHLAVAALCTAALPLVLAPLMPFFASLFGINGTDLLVAQYLKGNINLSAVQISDALAAKNTAMHFVFGGTSLTSKCLLLLFAMAALLRALYIGWNMLKIRQHVNESVVRFRSRRVEIRISNHSIVPYTTRGLFKYYIVIPSSLVSDPSAFRITLAHEAQHIRQGDVDWEILLSLVSPLFVINPAFWLISDRIRRFREYTCDAAILKKPGIDARDYCLLLLHFASKAARIKASSGSSTYTATVRLNGQGGVFGRRSKSALRKRILALSQGSSFIHDGFAKYVNLAPAVLLFVLVGAGVLMAAKPTDWSHDRLMLSTVANLERLDRINDFGVVPIH